MTTPVSNSTLQAGNSLTPPASPSSDLASTPLQARSSQALTRPDIEHLAFEMRRGTPEYVSPQERLLAARQLQERLSSAPFYAKRAAKAREAGNEMTYWLSLQSSQATAHRP